ncbi:MFS transporter [Paenibacillus sp. AK002]
MQRKISKPSLLLFIVLVGFPQISETIYTPSLPDIAHHLGAGNNAIQLTLSIYFLGFAFGVYCWGRLSDSIGRRPAMLWASWFMGWAAWAAICPLRSNGYGSAGSYRLLVPARALSSRKRFCAKL